MLMRFFLYLVVYLLLSSCDGALIGWQPAATFDPVAVPRPANLARVLGPAMTLVGPTDTLHLRVSFAPTTGVTTFVAAGSTQDTLRVRAFRFRGYYYLVETLPNTRQLVHAVRIRRGSVQGLGTGPEQMSALSRLVQKGEWPELVRYRNPGNDSICVRFDKKTLRLFFEAQADSLPIYRIQPATSGAARTTRPVGVPLPAVSSYSVYPNPAQMEATVSFGSDARRVTQLYSAAGVLLRTYPTDASQLTFPVEHLPAGTYIVRVLTEDTGATSSYRLLVGR